MPYFSCATKQHHVMGVGGGRKKKRNLILSGTKIKCYFGSSSIMQRFVTPGGTEPGRRHAGTMWPACKVYPLLLPGSVSCKGSVLRGLRAVHVTHDAKWSHVKLIAHRMREKLQEEWENDKGVSRSPLQPWHQHFGLVLLLNQTISDKLAGGYRLYIPDALVSCRQQSPDRGI